MTFVIISHVLHKVNADGVSAYAPYVGEMNVWLKHVDKVVIVAPVIETEPTAIDLHYKHDQITLKPISAIQFTSVSTAFISTLKVPYIFWRLMQVCFQADHVHLRCPGNIGLLGCLVQILFPKKTKTAKYAGNWDPKANQPLSYRFQKWLLSNTFLTRNMTVLVYGTWKGQTKNIKPFFTATYKKEERVISKVRDYTKALKFVFIGSLVAGKRPLLTIQIIEQLIKDGYDVSLEIFGDGILKDDLQAYIIEHNLTTRVKLLGNQSKPKVKEALKTAHFSILPSKSEGWPKAIAEAMFFGVVPIATPISCVPDMLDYGKRGVLIEGRLSGDVTILKKVLGAPQSLKDMSEAAFQWSQMFTLDYFESEIVKILSGS
ncbi:glycosyltransferase [Tamlana fucoidanivorans]|uniref:Glycosyltransferase n=1 Tax=Allotamlana fucoidanivorans TaxID=2583814 RepID=A0A5C4SNK1_9FLAO|nr:glycosyltransferase [Tamlana fucoidanivorans]TNJ45751.1 glycosyltransferase [Tamlana fucoidanivorans]